MSCAFTDALEDCQTFLLCVQHDFVSQRENLSSRQNANGPASREAGPFLL
jgi:hypothetical protein